MKQVQQNYRSGALTVAEVPAPRAADGRLLVATRASLISSGTERQLVELAKASLAGKAMARPDLVRRVVRSVTRDGLRSTMQKVLARLDTPIPLGFSIAGEVIEIGRGVNGFSVGDRVACAGAGLANHAEINSVPRLLAVPIPEGVDDDSACFVTLGAIALQGVRLAAPTLGETVIVLGLGLIGLLTVQLLKANGCRVIGYDPDAARTDLARSLGADAAVSDDLPGTVQGITSGLGADAVIVTASTVSSAPVNTAAEISRMKGRIVIVGMVGLSIDREPLYRRELDLKFSLSYGPGRHDPAYEQDGHDYPAGHVRWTEQRNMEAFLRLVADGKVTPQRLISHRFPIADAERAYAHLERGEPHLGLLLTYPEKSTISLVRSIGTKHKTAPPDNGIAFIGFGSYAKATLLPAVRASANANLSTVVTSTGLSAAHAASTYGFYRAASDPEIALADPAISTVFIATRHDTHAHLAAAALRAGKHVFCEKPLAIDDAGLADVMSAARASPGCLTVGFNRRFAPLMQKAKAALQPRQGPLVMLYRINAGALPADHWTQRAEGGGRIVGEVCHFVDTLTWLCGSPPTEVHAIAARDHADAVSILLRFADGSTGTIVYSTLGDPAVPKESLEAFAANRVIQLHDFRRLDVTINGRTRTTKSSQDKGASALVAAFLDATRTGDVPPIPLDDIATVTSATFAIEDSLRIGAPVRLDGT